MLIQLDNSIPNSDLLVAVWSFAQFAFENYVKDFGEACLVPQELSCVGEGCEIITMCCHPDVPLGVVNAAR